MLYSISDYVNISFYVFKNVRKSIIYLHFSNTKTSKHVFK